MRYCQNKNSDKMKTTLEIFSFVLLFLCIVAILVCGVLLVKNNSEQSVIKHEIQLSVVPDTLGMLPKDVYVVVDSLQEYIKTSEQRIADKYEYFLEQKKDENVLFSVGSLFGGIFISILGFFGYKSFKDIETKAEERASDIASKSAEEHLKNNLPQYVSGKLPSITNELTNTVCAMVQERLGSEISAEMEVVKEEIELLKMYVNEQNNSNHDHIEQGEADNLFG